MTYGTPVIIGQAIVVVMLCIVIGLTLFVYQDDKEFNDAKRITLKDSVLADEKLTLDERAVYREFVPRDVDAQYNSFVFFWITLGIYILNAYLVMHWCRKSLLYRRQVNMFIHMACAFFVLIGFGIYIHSFVLTNTDYIESIKDALLTNPNSNLTRHKCQFPKSDPEIPEMGGMCQAGWLKVGISVIIFLTFVLLIFVACVIGCFVMESFGTPRFYEEYYASDPLGPLPNPNKLPPLPYYCRPVAKSPTTNAKSRKNTPTIQFVEIVDDRPAFVPSNIQLAKSDQIPKFSITIEKH